MSSKIGAQKRVGIIFKEKWLVLTFIKKLPIQNNKLDLTTWDIHIFLSRR